MTSKSFAANFQTVGHPPCVSYTIYPSWRLLYLRQASIENRGTIMANKSIFVTALAVLLLGGIALAQTQPSPVQPAPVKRTIVGKADVPNSNYEAITASVTSRLHPASKPDVICIRVWSMLKCWKASSGSPSMISQKNLQGRRTAFATNESNSQ